MTEEPEASVTRLWDRIRLHPRNRLRWAEPVSERRSTKLPQTLMLKSADLQHSLPASSDAAFLRPQTNGRTRPCTLADLLPSIRRNICCDRADPNNGSSLRQLDGAFLTQTVGILVNHSAEPVASTRVPDRGSEQGLATEAVNVPSLAEFATMVQAALDLLHARWMADVITSAERQIALTALQAALRQRGYVEDDPEPIGTALVCLLPKTPDLIGAMLKVALLRQAMWSVRLLLAKSAEEITATARTSRPDLLVLVTSCMASRSRDREVLRQCIRGSANVPIVIGGKCAETDPQNLLSMGASSISGAITDIASTAAPFAAGKRIREQRERTCLAATPHAVLANRALAVLVENVHCGGGDISVRPCAANDAQSKRVI